MTTIMPPEKKQTSAPPSADPLRPQHTSTEHAPMASMIRLSAMALAGVAVIAVLFIIFNASSNAPRTGDVPLVSAEDAPFRDRPQDAGGMTVDNMDTTVYAAQQQGNAAATAGNGEQLRPQPEQPILGETPSADGMPIARRVDGLPAMTPEEIQQAHRARRLSGDAAGQAMEELETAASKLPPGAESGETSVYVNGQRAERLPLSAGDGGELSGTAAAPSAPIIEEAPVAVKMTEAPAPAASAGAPVAEAPVVQTPEVQEVGKRTAKPAPVPSADEASSGSSDVVSSPDNQIASSQKAEVSAETQSPKAVSSGSGTHMIQFGAVRSEDAAKSEMAKIQKKNASLLKGVPMTVVRADLGEKGTFWRLRAGPLSQDAAKKLCASLKAAGQDCIVVNK